jgi:hypothetical protein
MYFSKGGTSKKNESDEDLCWLKFKTIVLVVGAVANLIALVIFISIVLAR